jgi:hypothetical protein
VFYVNELKKMPPSFRSQILKVHAALFVLVAGLTFMTHVMHPTRRQREDTFESAPSARMFSDRGIRGSSRPTRAGVAIGGVSGGPIRWVAIVSKHSGRFLWRGDNDAILASANSEVPLSERVWEILDADPILEFVSFRFHSSNPNLNGRLLQVAPPPTSALILAPISTNQNDHSVQFRISFANRGKLLPRVHLSQFHLKPLMSGPLLSRSTNGYVAVVDDRVAPFGTLRCEAPTSGGMVGGLGHLMAPSRLSAFVLVPTSAAEIGAAEAEEAKAQREEDSRLQQETAELNFLFQQEPATPMHKVEKRVISFGLYGANPKYVAGALRNVELAAVFFPGWVCRFYHDSTVPRHSLADLRRLGAETVNMENGGITGGIAGMFWRFLVADDRSVDRFIVRDSDSR